MVSIVLFTSTDCYHISLYRLRQGKVGLQLGSHQKYYISQCEEKHSIQLTITVVGDDVTSVQERRELINGVTELLDDIMKVFLPAAKTPTPIVPCSYCPKLHIPLSEVRSGNTIFYPVCNDAELAGGYYGELVGSSDHHHINKHDITIVIV